MGGPDAGNLNLLIVEDNPGDADLLCAHLVGGGLQVKVRHVERLGPALEELRTARADAVLLDLNLPDATGLEGLNALRAAFPSVPVVVLTGASPEVGLEAVRSGAQDFVSKSGLDGPTLERAIRYSIERQKNHERAKELAEERLRRKAAEESARLLSLSYRLAEAALTQPDLRQCLRSIVREVRAGFSADSATLLLTTPDERSLIVEASDGLDEEGTSVPMGAGVAGQVAVSGVARAIDEVAHEQVFSPQLRKLSSMMITPLRLVGRVVGVLHVGSLTPRGYTPDEVRMLETVGSRVALVVENARLRERMSFEQARWRSVVESMADMVCLADPGGKVVYLNQALRRWIGAAGSAADPSELIAQAETRAFHLDGRPMPPAENPLGLAAQGHAVRDLGVVLRTERGEERIATWSTSLIRDPYGAIQAVVCIGHDVTESHRAHRALREADRRKDEFLAVLSHELRNPLAPMRNSLYVLSRAAPGSDQARRAVTVIDRQVGHMTRLIGDLLDVSRISRGKIQLLHERVDLREVVERSLEDLRSVFAARGLALEASLPPDPVPLLGDATRLAQSVTNLLNNAAKYTPSGGRVSVFLDRGGGQAVLRVVDTGVGIAPEMLARLFQPFAQADRTLDRSAGGLGLGLALVKGLVELHGGSVNASSDGPGHGAEFTLRLPSEPEGVQTGPPAGVAAAAPPTRANGQRVQRVLIIEDNVDAARSLQEVLELEQHEVAVAFSGPEGLEKARTFGPNVVLCDIGLPGMDGYDVARRLREERAPMCLVALTGYAQPEDQRRAQEAGFDLHLAKPPNLELIERVLQRCAAH